MERLAVAFLLFLIFYLQDLARKLDKTTYNYVERNKI